MKAEIEKAITLLAKQVRDETTPDAALKYTQAALNLAHVLQVQAHTKAADNSGAAPS